MLPLNVLGPLEWVGVVGGGVAHLRTGQQVEFSLKNIVFQ